MTSEQLYQPIAERLLSLSQAYKVIIECTYTCGDPIRGTGFFVRVFCTSLKRGGGSVAGYGDHLDNQAVAMIEALDMAYQAAKNQ